MTYLKPEALPSLALGHPLSEDVMAVWPVIVTKRKRAATRHPPKRSPKRTKGCPGSPRRRLSTENVPQENLVPADVAPGGDIVHLYVVPYVVYPLPFASFFFI